MEESQTSDVHTKSEFTKLREKTVTIKIKCFRRFVGIGLGREGELFEEGSEVGGRRQT